MAKRAAVRGDTRSTRAITIEPPYWRVSLSSRNMRNAFIIEIAVVSGSAWNMRYSSLSQNGWRQNG